MLTFVEEDDDDDDDEPAAEAGGGDTLRLRLRVVVTRRTRTSCGVCWPWHKDCKDDDDDDDGFAVVAEFEHDAVCNVPSHSTASPPFLLSSLCKGAWRCVDVVADAPDEFCASGRKVLLPGVKASQTKALKLGISSIMSYCTNTEPRLGTNP